MWMDSVINVVLDWVFASPWERLLLCAETLAIMIGWTLAWRHRWTLKSSLADMQRKQDKLLDMMQKMVGQSEEKQKKILGVARASVMEATATVNKRAPHSDSVDMP